MERSNKRRRMEPDVELAPTPVSAFAAAKARLQEKSVDRVAQGTATDIQVDDGIIAPGLAGYVERLSDYGDEEGGSEDDRASASQPADAEIYLSSWVRTTQNINEQSAECVIVRLAYMETLCLIGQYALAVQQGAVEVAGVTVVTGTNRCPIFAPSIDALPVIGCLSRSGAVVELHSQPDIQEAFRRLEAFSPDFRRIWASAIQENENSLTDLSFTIIHKAADDAHRRPLRSLDIPPGWTEALSLVLTPPERPRIIAITGVQAAGKADLCQALICNSLNATSDDKGRIFLVDLDPVRQSYTIPGRVSASVCSRPFIGPPFVTALHRKDEAFSTLLRSHAVPQSFAQRDGRHMLACATDLLSTCLRHASSPQSETMSPPTIIIKFPDISQGHGSSTTLALLKTLQPSKVLSVARGPPKILSDIAAACPPGVLYELEPLSSPNPVLTRTADEVHDMHLLASAHSRAGSATAPLAHQRPLCISYAGARQDLLAVAYYPDMPPLDKLSDLLTASLVSIILLEDPSRFDLHVKREEQSGLPYVHHASGASTKPFDPAHSHQVGVALVRAVDTKRQVLELLPIAGEFTYDERLAKQLVLVHGCFGSPRAILSEEIYWRQQATASKFGSELIDDSVDTSRQAMTIPFVEVVTGEQDLKEARWKSRKFNMGGGG